MSLRSSSMTAVFVAMLTLRASVLCAGQCNDPDGVCPDPCPAEKSCLQHEDCPEGQVCVPACLPSWCFCDVEFGSWACSLDCAGECIDEPESPGPATYTIIDLGTLGGSTANAHGLNNFGHVVGEADLPDGRRHAFLWKNGEMSDLGALSGDLLSSAWDVNNLGQVIVNSTFATSSWHAFVWEPSGITTLGDLGISDAKSFAISDGGHVVGGSRVSAFTMDAFLWEGGLMTDLVLDGFESRIAWDVNNAGHAVGGPSLWQDGIVTDLSVLFPGAVGALAINDSDQVLLVAELDPTEIFAHPFVWQDGALVDLRDVTGREREEAYAINNCGEVLIKGAGVWGTDFFIYHPNRPLAHLRGVEVATTEWLLLRPQGMNDRGQVVGSGSHNGLPRGFLLAPLPGDLDGNGYTELADFGQFNPSITGPREPAIPRCERADLDLDADVDLRDFAEFQREFRPPTGFP